MPQESPSRKLDQYIVRFPDGMRDRIKEAAEANNRSMNAEIVARLESSFKAKLFDHVESSDRKVYVLIDADGQPMSWNEIDQHLGAIRTKLGSESILVDARVIDRKDAPNSEREIEWRRLQDFYRKQFDGTDEA